MSSYAAARGLPLNASFVEDESRDTIGNAFFCGRRWLRPNEWRSVRVVTTDYHIPRAAWIFRKVDDAVVIGTEDRATRPDGARAAHGSGGDP